MDYQNFISTKDLAEEKIYNFTEMLLNKSLDNKSMVDKTFKRISDKLILSESRKELVYSYYKIFSKEKAN